MLVIELAAHAMFIVAAGFGGGALGEWAAHRAVVTHIKSLSSDQQ